MDLINIQNKFVLSTLYKVKSQTADMKEKYLNKNNFPMLVTITVRNKLYSNIIKVFKLLKDNDTISCWRLLPRIYKQIRIHKNQLRKIEKKSSYELNGQFLNEVIKFILKQLFYLNKKKNA